MTAEIIRHRVSLKTGKTISRETIGETEIADGEYLKAMSIAVTGMRLDELCEKIKEGDHTQWESASRSSAWMPLTDCSTG